MLKYTGGLGTTSNLTLVLVQLSSINLHVVPPVTTNDVSGDRAYGGIIIYCGIFAGPKVAAPPAELA